MKSNPMWPRISALMGFSSLENHRNVHPLACSFCCSSWRYFPVDTRQQTHRQFPSVRPIDRSERKKKEKKCVERRGDSITTYDHSLIVITIAISTTSLSLLPWFRVVCISFETRLSSIAPWKMRSFVRSDLTHRHGCQHHQFRCRCHFSSHLFLRQMDFDELSHTADFCHQIGLKEKTTIVRSQLQQSDWLPESDDGSMQNERF